MDRVIGRCCSYVLTYFLKYLGNIELQKGTAIIISYINLIVNVILIVTNSFVIEAGIAVLKDGDEEYHQAGVIVTAVAGVFMLFLILFLAFAIALIVGLKQDKASHMKRFQSYATMMSFLFCIAFIVYAVNKICGAIYIFPNLISFFWYIYFKTVIKNQYRRIKEAADGPTVDDTTANI